MNKLMRVGLWLGMLALLAGGEARAANIWDGGGADDNWGTAANWDNDTVPSFPQTLTFAGMTRLTPTNETPRTVTNLVFYGDAGAFTIGGSTITLGGNITNNSTTVQTINNNITLSAARTVNSVFGAGTVLGGIIGQSAANYGLTKNGAGTVTLKGDNAFNGTVTLNGAGGITQIGHNSAFGLGTAVTLTAGTLQPVDGSRALSQAITVTDHIISGAQHLTFNGKVTGASGAAAKSLESSLDAGKVLTLAGGLDVAADSGNRFFCLYGRGDTTIGVIANGSATSGRLLFRNAGTTTLTGINTYNGYTVLGGGGTVILDYAAGDGSKFADAGVLHLAYDGNSYATMGGGDLVLKGGSHMETNASVNAQQAGQTNVRRDGGTSVLQMNTITLGAGSINFAEDDLATCDNANANGILMTGLGGFGPLTVGGTDWAYNFGGGADGQIRAYTGYLAMPLTGGVTTENYITNGSATLTGNLSFNTLKLTGNGTLKLGATGNYSLMRNTYVGAAILYAGTAGQTYTITDDNGGAPGTGQITSGGALYNFGVYVNAGELIFDVNWADGGPIKAGQGRMTLNQANVFRYGPQVNEGALRLRHSYAVSNKTITVNASVFGSALELNKDTGGSAISIPTNAALAILGSGITNSGALRNIAGDNTYGGAITIGGSGSGLGIGARINADADTLAITNGITTAAGRDVTFGGAGNITVSTTKITGAGAVNKDGAGTLTVAAANDYTSNTTVNAGRLVVTNTGSIASGSKVTVNSGGTLAGNGICSGAVFVVSGATIQPTGNLTVGDLALQSGSTNLFDGTSRVIVNNAGAVATTAGLTILPGAQVSLNGTFGAGIYTNLQYSGDLKGSATNLTVANPESGKGYTFSADGTYVVLTVVVLPVVTLMADDPAAAESPLGTGSFTVSRGARTDGNLTVNFTIASGAGNATPGVANDYTLSGAGVTWADGATSGSAVIPDTATNATITVTPVDDPTTEPLEAVTLTISNSPTTYVVGSPSNDTVTITSEDSAHSAPVVNAGTSQSILTNAFPAGANLDGTVSDVDGLPSGVLTSLWSKVSGPGTVTFGNVTNVDTTASFGAAGDYVLQLWADDTALQASNTVAISVYLRTVSVQATDGTCGLTAGDPGTFQISRPDTGTNEALTVNYALSGATSYVSASPASGFTLAVGQTSTNVTLTPLIPNFASATNVILSLVPGVYALGTPGAATCTVAQVTATALTLGTNAYLNGSSQLIRDGDQAVLLTATSGTGATNSPYVFDLGGHLAMAGFTIRGATNSTVNQYSATWQVWGNVTGNGNFDSYAGVNGTNGGHVRIDAGGSIALGRVVTYPKYNALCGDVYLWAKGGSVAVTNAIDANTGISYGGYNAGRITIRSEGAVAGQAITIGGTADGTNSVRAYAAHGRGGDTRLYCQGPVTLAGGIRTSAAGDNGADGTAGTITIRGSQDTPSLRAGAVALGAGINSSCNWRYLGGDVNILAASCAIGGNLVTSSTGNAGYGKGGGVVIDTTNDCTIAGYIDTRTDGGNNVGPCGRVTLSGQHIRVAGTNAAGVSILAQPDADYTGTMWSPVAGDGDVTLTGGDSTTLTYDPLNPTNGATSSIFLAGGIKAQRASNSILVKGDVRLTAVEVQLGGGISVTNADSGTVLAMRYGVTTYGIVTHLVEQGVRWDGSAAHLVTYTNIGAGASAPTFTADVPYAGALVVNIPGTIFNQTVTNVTQTSALFRGRLQEDGSPAAAVSVRWGETAGNLDQTNGWTAGAWGDNSYPKTNITLLANKNIYYAFVAENAGGTNVAAPAEYLITGPVTPATTEGTCGESQADTATLAISRLGTCLDGPLTVNCALSGATGYVSASPASGFTLAAGQASTNVVFTPLRPNLGAPVSVTLTLLPGAYPSDALGSDSISVATAVGYSLTAASDTQISNALDVVENPPDTVACSVAGSTNTYDFWTSSLNLNGQRIYAASGTRNLVLTNLAALTDSGAGRIDTSTINYYTDGGGIVVQAPGGIALNGTNSNGYTIDSSSTSINAQGGGEVTLIATGGVTLTKGGIRTEANYAGRIWISDGAGGSAGNVSIAGALNAYSAGDSRGRDGSVLVRGAAVTIASNVLTGAAGSYGNGKPITMVASGALTIGGYIAAQQASLPYSTSGGAVSLTGATVTVSGTTNGMSISTWAATNYAGNVAGNIRVTATAGDLTLAGGLDAWHPNAAQRGVIALSASNGCITVGSLDANRFKTISLQANSGLARPVMVTGVLANFAFSQSPKTVTLPTGSAVASDVYYRPVMNAGIPLTGNYAIFVGVADTGWRLRQLPAGTLFTFR